MAPIFSAVAVVNRATKQVNVRQVKISSITTCLEDFPVRRSATRKTYLVHAEKK